MTFKCIKVLIQKSVDSLHNAISVLEKCISEVSQWMVMNKLQLNKGKTEALLLVSPQLKHHLPQQVSVSVGNISIVLFDCVRTLGVEIDASLSMSGQVTALCKSLNFHLYNISRVRKMLTEDACSHAIRSLVLSRLDYSNSLLINVSKMDIGGGGGGVATHSKSCSQNCVESKETCQGNSFTQGVTLVAGREKNFLQGCINCL